MQFRSYKPTKKPNHKRSLLLLIVLVLIVLLWKNAAVIAGLLFDK